MTSTVAIEPSWELYRSFLAVFRRGSLSGAARATDLTQPTIGRHVEALEAALGTSLFIRSQRGLQPTRAASALAPHAEAMERAAAALRRTASGEDNEARGVVRVTASEVVGTEVLPAAFAAFRAANPRVDVELSLSNRTADLLQREADLAVRMVKPTQTMLLARKIGSVRIGLFAHPRYLVDHGTPRTYDALGEHALIGYDSAASIRPPPLPFKLHRDQFGFRCDSEVGQYAALRAGFGIGFAQVGIARRDALTRLFPEVHIDLGVWLVMHKASKSVRRVRLLFDYLAGYLGDYTRGE